MQRWIFLMILVIAAGSESIVAQKLGIRAGLNFSKFQGPEEPGVIEKNTYTNGFHFGFTYSYPIFENLHIRGELLYSQLGNNLEYEGESYYRIRTDSKTATERGNSIMNLKVTNTYIGIPILLQYTIKKKFEISFGGYVNYLVQSRGLGQQRFISYDRPAEIFMKQSLDHNYKKDVAGGGSLSGPAVIVDGKVVFLFKNTGAYYQMTAPEKSGNLYNNIDYGLTGGLSYFVTKGFFIGLRYDYGLTDLTNNRMDPSRRSLDENGEFIYLNHFDRHVAFNVSMGFRF
jgi:hypothetical protein